MKTYLVILIINGEPEAITLQAENFTDVTIRLLGMYHEEQIFQITINSPI